MAKGSRRSARRAEALAALRSGDDTEGRRLPAGERIENGYVVRSVAGTVSPGPYRCPGCDQELAAGTPHVVAWPEGRPEDRRHWHTVCWTARGRRGVKLHRSKNAPRYG